MDNKPNILIIINRLVIGGQAIDTIPLAWYLQENFSVHVLYGEKENDEEEALFLLDLYPGLQIEKLPLLQRSISPARDFAAYRAIKNILKKNEFAVVHTHGFKSGMLGRLAAHAMHVPCIVHTFHGHLFHSYYNQFISASIIRLERMLGRITSRIITISPQQLEEISGKFSITPISKTRMIRLGIDEKHFFRNLQEDKNSFKEKYNLKDDEIHIGIIGRIVQIKNFTLFADVAEKVLAAYPARVKFYVVGDGILAGHVQDILLSKNISFSAPGRKNENASVIFTSWAPDIATVINALDIVMLTSYNEGTPMSLIEAQLCGKPVVATNVGGVSDTFIAEKTGFLIPPGDADLFAKKLILLIENEQLRKEMGAAAVNFATENFSKKTEVQKVTDLYHECLQNK